MAPNKNFIMILFYMFKDTVMESIESGYCESKPNHVSL